MINLPRESKTATEIVAWWTSMPIYFSWLITALLSVGGDTNNHNLQQSGRLLYCVHSPVSSSVSTAFPMHKYGSASRFIPRIRRLVEVAFRDCRHFFMLRPPS